MRFRHGPPEPPLGYVIPGLPDRSAVGVPVTYVVCNGSAIPALARWWRWA